MEIEKEREENERKISKSSKLNFCRHIVASDIYIHFDLQVEILKKLPAKSLLKFCCVSKQWSTIIRSRNFIDSIIDRPLANPPSDNLHFIFFHYSPKHFFFFSSTYTYKEQQAVSIPQECEVYLTTYQYVHGLILCLSIFSHLLIIYNPTTRKSIFLPEIESQSNGRNSFFGYAPVIDQYKVMCFTNEKDKCHNVCKVFTLGDPMKKWRNIQNIGNHSPVLQKVHINGIIYYAARYNNNINEDMVMSFDFNSERFYHINAPTTLTRNFFYSTFVNYKGKLGCLCPKFSVVEMWVMEDPEKQTWSKTIFDLPNIPFDNIYNNIVECNCFCGITLDGDIFIVQNGYVPDDPLYVYYLNPKQNSFRRTEIKGTNQRNGNMYILGVFDHVENIMSLHQSVGE